MVRQAISILKTNYSNYSSSSKQKDMKATIDEKGIMLIEAETPLESFALQCWAANFMRDNNNDHITIKTSIDK